MPGKHSPAKLLERRSRAYARGYMRPRLDDKSSKWLVATNSFNENSDPNARLDIVFQNDPWSRANPNPSTKSSHPLSCISSPTVNIKDSPLLDRTGQVRCAPCPSGVGSKVQFTPAQFLGAPAHEKGGCPSSSLSGVSAGGAFNADAEVFQPASQCFSIGASPPTCGAWGSDVLLLNAFALIEAQKAIIDRLIAENERLLSRMPPCGIRNDTAFSSDDDRYKELEMNLRSLADSIPLAVEDSMMKKLPELVKPFLTDALDDLMKMNTDSCSSLAQDITEKVNETMVSNTTSLLRNYDMLMQKRFVEQEEKTEACIAARFEACDSLCGGPVARSSPSSSLHMPSQRQVRNPTLSCVDFLEMARVAKLNVPFASQLHCGPPMKMIRDGFYDPLFRY